MTSRTMTPAGSLRRLLEEGLSAEGAKAVRRWLTAAEKARGEVRPLMLSGEGAEELAALIVIRAVRRGVDAAVAPWSWVNGKLPSHLPKLTVVLPRIEPVDECVLETMAKRTALLLAGDAVPLMRGASGFLLDLSPQRVADLRWLEAAGWPQAPAVTR